MKRIVFLLAALTIFCGCGKSSGNEEKPFLPAPADISASNAEGGIHIRWNQVPDADYYEISISGNGMDFTFLANTEATEYLDLKKSSEPITLYYKIRACRNTGIFSDYSAVVSVIYDPKPAPDTVLPAPAGLSASLNGSSVSLSWEAVPGASEYLVYRNSSAAGEYIPIGSTTDAHATDPAPMKGDNYYTVAAYNGTVGDPCAPVLITIKEEEPDKPAKPATPTNVRAVQNGNAITVSWNAAKGAAHYQVWAKRPAPYDIEDFVNIDAPATSTNFEWPTMQAGTYTFWVVAVNSNYENSSPSSRVTCNFKTGGGGETTPKKLDTPTGLEAFGQTGWNYVQISFTEVPLAYAYELYRSQSASGTYKKITASGGTSSGRYILTDSNPLAGTSYYKVKAIPLSYLGIEASDLSPYVSVTR